MLSQIETRRVQLSGRGDLPAEPAGSNEPEAAEDQLHPTDAPTSPIDVEEAADAPVLLTDPVAKDSQAVVAPVAPAAPAAPAQSLALHSPEMKLLKEEAVRGVTPLTATAPAAPKASPEMAAVLSTVEELQVDKFAESKPAAVTPRTPNAPRAKARNLMPSAGAPPAAAPPVRARAAEFYKDRPETETLSKRFAMAAGAPEQLATAEAAATAKFLARA